MDLIKSLRKEGDRLSGVVSIPILFLHLYVNIVKLTYNDIKSVKTVNVSGNSSL